ncbi:MAG TPA: prolyl oligopeptidase family serine peptidase [Streptosporangiaceae bacterium]|nr:prolyl oligopeptidase family serine peptidase [Streptosporangiaceae bacterium]
MSGTHQMSYPEARRLDLTEDIFGHQVSDPYRWMEDAGSAERADWLQAEAALFSAERAHWPGRDILAERVRELLNVGVVGTPAWRGDRSFFTKREPGQEHAVLCTQVAGGPVEVLVDPMAIDPSGLTTLDAWQPDKEGRLLAYQLSEGGDEESLLRVLDVETGSVVDGPIDRCRYSNVAWLPGGKAFYYARRLPPASVPDGESQYHRRVYLHQVGTVADEQDVLIFGTGRDKTDYYYASVSRDGRWLFLSASRGTAPRNDLFLADLAASDPSSPDLQVVQEGVDAQTSVRAGRDGLMYVFTDLGAPRGRIAVADPGSVTDRASWRDLIAEDAEAVLSGYAILDGPELARPVLLASWSRHALSEITVHDLASGALLASVELPGLGTAGGLSERPEGGHEAWFGYTDYTTPPLVLRFDARDSSVRTWAVAPGSVAVPAVTARQVTYQSLDGTSVRMLVISGASDGPPGAPRPALLTGYGGFDISLTPAYSPSALAWVEAGGVYAVANLRGGSEEGEEWHRAGMLEHKQNVFDDFRCAASALIADGWTTAGQLAISGGSNGGLLVGASLVQSPDLYAAVVCSAPLLDMVRYERFGLGQTWNVEYGSASDPVQLSWLLSYSPYHHVVPGTAYPAVLFTVFTNDTRVDPVHAYKMCAALQHASVSGRPVLLRAEGQVGHGARAVSRTAELAGDTLAFAARYTGLVVA